MLRVKTRCGTGSGSWSAERRPVANGRIRDSVKVAFDTEDAESAEKRVEA